MTTFTMIILILFVAALAFQFVASIDKECYWLSVMFAFEIMAFAYLAKVLMSGGKENDCLVLDYCSDTGYKRYYLIHL